MGLEILEKIEGEREHSATLTVTRGLFVSFFKKVNNLFVIFGQACLLPEAKHPNPVFDFAGNTRWCKRLFSFHPSQERDLFSGQWARKKKSLRAGEENSFL